MKLIEWIKERCKEESYVTNVKDADKKGLTYQPELYKDCTYRKMPRYMYDQDIFMAGGWRK